MKKAIKFMGIFIMVLTFVSGFFLIEDNTIVEAVNECVNGDSAKDGRCVSKFKDGDFGNGGTIGSVTITKNGEVKIEYANGYNEFIIYAEECKEYEYEGTGKNRKRTGVCKNEVYGVNKQIIFTSGNYRRKDQDVGTKSVHLYKYYDYDAVVKVSVFVNFAKNSDGNNYANSLDPADLTVNNTGFYAPLYCDEAGSVKNCQNVERLGTVEDRLANLQSGIGITNAQLVYTDRMYLVYYGDGVSNDYANNGSGAIANIKVFVDNTAVTGASDEVNDIVFDTIVPALIAILGIAGGVSIAVLGYQIVKSADEPQERQQKISNLKNILIGIGVALLLLLVSDKATAFIKKWID